MDIRRVGVVGCGVMGSGIAQLCAQSGYQVVVSEVTQELLRKGLASINWSLEKTVEKGKLSRKEKDSIFGRIKGTTDIKDFSGCDLMIEAVTEDLELKKEVFRTLDGICAKEAILATNTSVLSIIDMARVTSKPEKVVGLHFLTPAPVIKLLEVVRTLLTTDETVEIATEFGKSLGKVIVVATDTPGFITNRLLTPFLFNAIRMLETGVASKEDIETVAKVGLSLPMGPLELLDLIGIDTVLRGGNALYEELKEPQYAPPILMRKMVAAGWYGRKTGKGFYEYASPDQEPKRSNWKGEVKK